MKIEIRDSGGETDCPKCGAGAPLFQPDSNASFEADFHKRIDTILGESRWWQWSRKAKIASVKELTDQLAHELREATKKL